ncbi:MAG: ABC transporter ATP-binding protein [Burkholderiaceae bacterium]
MSPLLEVRGLHTMFDTDEGVLAAVDGVSFRVEAGRTLAIVGESGCGKSVTALSIMGLLPQPAGRVSAGSVRFEGRELIDLPQRELQDLRGDAMAMIFQEPMSSLNPAFTIGEQIVETLLRHRPMTRAQAEARALEVLRQVRMAAPEQRLFEYPHKLSGGMRQRAMIAMALACEPRLLIADEPTTALDVTIQAQILDLMRTLQAETGTAIVLITHDLGVVAEMADDVLVMYAGQVVEHAAVARIFSEPQHPYTVGLLGALPRLDDLQQTRLAAIDGQLPDPLRLPQGCRFAARCPFVQAPCREQAPALRDVGDGHLSACRRAPLDPAQLRSASPVQGRPVSNARELVP